MAALLFYDDKGLIFISKGESSQASKNTFCNTL